MSYDVAAVGIPGRAMITFYFAFCVFVLNLRVNLWEIRVGVFILSHKYR